MGLPGYRRHPYGMLIVRLAKVLNGEFQNGVHSKLWYRDTLLDQPNQRSTKEAG
jgi:hypothetical protein